LTSARPAAIVVEVLNNRRCAPPAPPTARRLFRAKCAPARTRSIEWCLRRPDGPPRYWRLSDRRRSNYRAENLRGFRHLVSGGRLFPQAARLAYSPHRPVVLIEEPKPSRLPDVHPHALRGAIISIAVMWRLPVLHSRDPGDSLQILQLLAVQASRSDQPILRRYDRKPKRIASRRLHVLQGLPGVGPALAHRLLLQLGSVERVVTADETTLSQVRGLGPKKAARIRELGGKPPTPEGGVARRHSLLGGDGHQDS